MKLIKQYNNYDNALTFHNKLKAAGIASHCAMSKGNNEAIYGGGQKLYAVWALLENQYEDAMMLRKGNRHQVKNPLSEEELIAIEKYRNKKVLPTFYLHLTLFLIFLASLSIFMLYISNDFN